MFNPATMIAAFPAGLTSRVLKKRLKALVKVRQGVEDGCAWGVREHSHFVHLCPATGKVYVFREGYGPGMGHKPFMMLRYVA